MENYFRLDRLLAVVVVGVVLGLAGTFDPLADAFSRLSTREQVLIPGIGFYLLYVAVQLGWSTIQWRVLHRERYLGGVWIFQQHDRSVEQYVYGVFEVKQAGSEIWVPRAITWNSPGKPNPTNIRGTWSSTRALVSGYQVEIAFEVKSLVAEPETGFVGYQGVMSLTVTSRGRMTGQFADLGLRRGHYGIVIAERITTKGFAVAAAQAEQVYREPAMER